MTREQYFEPVVMLVTLIRWFILASVTAVIVGLGTSLFLKLLFYSTNETSHLSMGLQILLLPIGVFGTPMAGAIYGIEVLTIGQLRFTIWLSCRRVHLVRNKSMDWNPVQLFYLHKVRPSFRIAICSRPRTTWDLGYL